MLVLRRLVIGVVAMLLPVTAAAQMARHAYDITSYDLNIRPDFTTGAISLRVALRITNAAAAESFDFGLSARYVTVTATIDGQAAPITRTGSTIAVANTARRRDVELEFELAGTPGKSEDENRPVIDADSLFLLWSDRFYPIDFADWATVRTSVLLPAGMSAIGPGSERSETPTAAGVWHVFESRTPSVKFSVLADRRWVRATWRVGRVRMVTLLHPEVASRADALRRTSADVLQYYSALHGFYPADQFAFVTVAGMFARRAFPGFVGYEPSYLIRTLAEDGYDAHETSLLWWGYATHGEGPGAFQWTEGFGDYVEVLYTRARHTPVSANLRRARDRFLAANPPLSIAPASLTGSSPQPAIHGDLPWRMDAVRRAIGGARFRAAIQRLFRIYRWRTFTLDEFVAVFEQQAPASVRPRVRPLLTH
jgi:hypothetical protein